MRHASLRPICWLGCFAIVMAAVLATSGTAKAEIDFAKEIQPILKNRCYHCHGDESQEGGLRLHHRDSALAGGDSGKVIIPGDPDASSLIKRLKSDDDDYRMPNDDDPLPEDEIAALEKWIKEGAKWPDDAAGKLGEVKHWAYQPIAKVTVPPVKNSAWLKTPIDAFILAKLEAEGLSPADELDRAKLIRRASIDLTGLPPTPAEIEAFVNDPSPDAYEQAVDRLLASPAYGERWAAMWLDLARYADTQGYEKDGRRTIWRYRDWLIDATNRDLAFDQFTIQQLAGDLLPDATTDQILATAFHRNTMTNTEGGTDDEEFRVAAIVDRVNTTMQVWNGTTFNCCQCHSHKYDPFTQREYYGMFAFFNQTEDADRGNEAPTIPTPTHLEQQELAAIELALDAARRNLQELQARDGSEAEIKAAEALVEQLQKAHGEIKPPTTPIFKELPQDKHRATHVLMRGSFLDKGDAVDPIVPDVLHELPQAESNKPNRLDLANWIVDDANPLMPRVIVNRYWERFFGIGLVETSEDFGTQGTPPSHPELLDWLAADFRDGGWSVKRLHRQIVLSAAYQQSSAVTPELVEKDPYNRLLARGPRVRLAAEQVRDHALAAAGLLSKKIGGPSVMPAQPDGVWQVVYSGDSWKTADGEDAYRRGIYTFWRRTSPYPSMISFDAPSREFCVVKRSRTNTPLQALTTLNDPVYVEAAQATARHVISELAGDDSRMLRNVYLRVLSREPQAAEVSRLLAYLNLQREQYAADMESAKQFAGTQVIPDGSTVQEVAAWTAVVNVVMNLDEAFNH